MLANIGRQGRRIPVFITAQALPFVPFNPCATGLPFIVLRIDSPGAVAVTSRLLPVLLLPPFPAAPLPGLRVPFAPAQQTRRKM